MGEWRKCRRKPKLDTDLKLSSKLILLVVLHHLKVNVGRGVKSREMPNLFPILHFNRSLSEDTDGFLGAGGRLGFRRDVTFHAQRPPPNTLPRSK